MPISGETLLKRVQQLQSQLADATAESYRWKEEAAQHEREKSSLQLQLDKVRKDSEAAMKNVIDKASAMESLLRKVAKKPTTSDTSAQCSTLVGDPVPTNCRDTQTVSSSIHMVTVAAQTPTNFTEGDNSINFMSTIQFANDTNEASSLPVKFENSSVLLAVTAISTLFPQSCIMPRSNHTDIAAPVCVSGWWQWITVSPHNKSNTEVLKTCGLQWATNGPRPTADIIEYLSGCSGHRVTWRDITPMEIGDSVHRGDVVLLQNRAQPLATHRAEGLIDDVLLHNGELCFSVVTAFENGGFWDLQKEWMTSEQLSTVFDCAIVVKTPPSDSIDTRLPCSVDGDGTVSIGFMLQGDVNALNAPRIVTLAGESLDTQFVPRGQVWAILCPEAIGAGIKEARLAFYLPHSVVVAFTNPPPRLSGGTFQKPRKKTVCLQANGTQLVTSELSRRHMNGAAHTEAVDTSTQTMSAPAEAEIPSTVVGQQRIHEMRQLIAEERFLESSATYNVLAEWGGACNLLFEHAAEVVSMYWAAVNEQMLHFRFSVESELMENVADVMLCTIQGKFDARDRMLCRQYQASELGVALAERFVNWCDTVGGMFQNARLVQSHYWQRDAPQLMVSHEVADFSSPSVEDLAYYGGAAIDTMADIVLLVMARLNDEVDFLLGEQSEMVERCGVTLEENRAHISLLETKLLKPPSTEVSVQCSGDRPTTAAHSSANLRHKMQMAALTTTRRVQSTQIVHLERHMRTANDERVIATQRAQYLGDALDAAQRDIAELSLRLKSSEEERSSTVQRLAAAYARVDELQTNLHECATQLAQIEATQYTIRAEYEHAQKDTEEQRDALEKQLLSLQQTLKDKEVALAEANSALEDRSERHVTPSVAPTELGLEPSNEQLAVPVVYDLSRRASSSSIHPLPQQFRQAGKTKPFHERKWRN